MVGVEYSLKVSASHLLRFGIYSVLKIRNERISESINQSMNYEGVYRTAPATQVLLKNTIPKLLNKPLQKVLLVTQLKYLTSVRAQ